MRRGRRNWCGRHSRIERERRGRSIGRQGGRQREEALNGAPLFFSPARRGRRGLALPPRIALISWSKPRRRSRFEAMPCTPYSLTIGVRHCLIRDGRCRPSGCMPARTRRCQTPRVPAPVHSDAAFVDTPGGCRRGLASPRIALISCSKPRRRSRFEAMPDPVFAHDRGQALPRPRRTLSAFGLHDCADEEIPDPSGSRSCPQRRRIRRYAGRLPKGSGISSTRADLLLEAETPIAIRGNT